VGDEGQQGGQHRDDGERGALTIPEGVVTRIQGAGDDARLTCAGAIAIDVSLLAKAGGGARRSTRSAGRVRVGCWLTSWAVVSTRPLADPL
jgi:hypothetical protein